MSEQEVKLSPRKKKIYGFIIVFFVTIIMSAIIELASIIILKNQGKKTLPFLFSFSGKEKIKNYMRRYNYLDPHLGYSHNNEMMGKKKLDYLMDGFAVYGIKESKPGNVVTIITLGGSTTDPAAINNWPKQLSDIFKEKGWGCEIFNGAVAGYSSNQELLKMIRDCLPLKPDIIICMNGVNDLGYTHSLKSHPMVDTYQQRLFNYILKSPHKPSPIFPNTISLLKSTFTKKQDIIAGINYGPEVKTTPEDQWKRNIIIMNTVAREFKIEYLCFLQPILGFGEYNPTASENEMLKERGNSYINYVNSFYKKAREMSKELPFCVDITDVFKGLSGIYKDPRHPNTQGYRLMAETVFNELEMRGLLKREMLQNQGKSTDR